MKTILVIIAVCLTGCVPNVTYKGKYGDYTATPSGFFIVPKYAIDNGK